MASVAELLQLAEQNGLAKLDAQLLLLHALDTSLAKPSQTPSAAQRNRAWLVAHADDAVATEPEYRFQQLVQARASGEPLAYLTASQAFWNLDLQVSPHVLIPRPDTETLVEWALALPLASHAKVLDLGTGSGAIALALKKERPDWRVTAVDFSAEALQVAQSNAKAHQLDIIFEHSHWFSSITPALFDLIVSNPPYIAEGDPHLETLTHEPQLALTSGVDGLDAIKEICEIAPAFLRPNGYLLLEHGYDQGERVALLLRQQGFSQVSTRQDLGGNTRCTGGRYDG